MTAKKIKRGDDTVHEVVDECETDYCVEVEFEYHDAPHKRKLRLWWPKDLCEVVE